ncbi:MAG: DNA primase [Oscillospiraceae bacterium]|nr:DNA primase [Oscillospiraceae bacterium]
MALPDQFLQELKLRSDMVDVASGYVNLKKRGRNYVGLCPFHSEKTPSFHVYPDSNSYYCFGCHAGGDVINFIRGIENLDYMEAVKFLADRAGMQMPEASFDNSLSKLRGRILELNRETARFYHRCLIEKEGREGLLYFRRRGLSDHTIRRFGLGYSPPSRFALTDHLSKLGYTPQEQIQANVAFSSRSGHLVDRFAGRVMFPIIDLRGNVIAFGGRILTDGTPKYLNTSDTPVFQKSRNLFAMNFAKNTRDNRLLLVEGYMDVIALHQAGFQNAVATLGTALTQEQAQLMARYVEEVVICYDADDAGQRAAQRAIHFLRDVGVRVKVLVVPDGKDPDEYIRSHGEQGVVRFRQMMDDSDNDVQYQLHKIKARCDLSQPEGKIAYLNGAAEIIAQLDNSMERDVYAGRLAEETKIDRNAVMLQINKLRRSREKNRQKKEFREYQQQVTGMKDAVNPEKFHHLRCANAEEGIIAFLLQGPSDREIKAIWQALPPEKFRTTFNRRVYEAIMGRLLTGAPCGLTELSGEFSSEEISAISRMIAKYSDGALRYADALEYSTIIEQEYLKSRAENVTDASAEDVQSYLQTLKEQKK